MATPTQIAKRQLRAAEQHASDVAAVREDVAALSRHVESMLDLIVERLDAIEKTLQAPKPAPRPKDHS